MHYIYTYTYRASGDSGSRALRAESSRLWIRENWRYGRFPKVHVSIVVPGPGALNSCLHAFPKNMLNLLWLNAWFYDFGYGIWNPRIEVLRIEVINMMIIMFLSIYIYIYICINIYICIYIYIHTYIHTYMHTFIHTYVHTYIHIYIYI